MKITQAIVIKKVMLALVEKYDEGRTSSKKNLIYRLPYFQDVARYKFAKKFMKGKNVLNVACGEGYSSEILAKSDVKKVYGIDIDKNVILKASAKGNKKIIFKVDNAEKTRFKDNFFDCIISIETIEHLKNPKKFLNELKRVSKKDSIIVISTPNGTISKKGKFTFGKYHTKEYTTKEMQELLDEYFKIDYIYHQMPFKKNGWFIPYRIIYSYFFRFNKFKLRDRNTSGIVNIFICQNDKR